MLKCAVIDGLIDRNPCEGVKVKPESNKEMLIATPAQAKMIRAAIETPYKLLVETMFATGMRYSELMGLRPQDIEFCGDVTVIKAGRSVLVEVAGKPIHRDYGKTKNASRDVRVSADLGRRLIDGVRNGFVFRAQRGGYLCRSNFWARWKRACAAAGRARAASSRRAPLARQLACQRPADPAGERARQARAFFPSGYQPVRPRHAVRHRSVPGRTGTLPGCLVGLAWLQEQLLV